MRVPVRCGPLSPHLKMWQSFGLLLVNSCQALLAGYSLASLGYHIRPSRASPRYLRVLCQLWTAGLADEQTSVNVDEYGVTGIRRRLHDSYGPPHRALSCVRHER
jgi:hypothetical protein